MLMKSRASVATVVGGMILFAMAGVACGVEVTNPEIDQANDELSAANVLVLGPISKGATRSASYTRTPLYRAFSFAAAAGEAVEFSVESANGDTVAYILDAQFKTRVRNDNASASTKNSKVTFTASTTGSYFVAFLEKKGLPTSLTVRFLAPPRACFTKGSGSGSISEGPYLAHQGVCTPSQVTAMTAACVTAGSNSAACAAFQQANPDCARCGFGLAPGEAPSLRLTNPQPVLLAPTVAGDLEVPNLWGCAAAVIKANPNSAYEATRPWGAVNDLLACSVEQCSGCDQTNGDFDTCLNRSRYGAPSTTSCAKWLVSAQPEENYLYSTIARWKTECGLLGTVPATIASTGVAREQVFSTMATTLCGN